MSGEERAEPITRSGSGCVLYSRTRTDLWIEFVRSRVVGVV